VARAIHLTPRGVVTDDPALFEELKKYLRSKGVKFKELKDERWYKCYVSGITGGDLLRLTRLFAEQVGNTEVWLFMSRVYPPGRGML